MCVWVCTQLLVLVLVEGLKERPADICGCDVFGGKTCKEPVCDAGQENIKANNKLTVLNEPR